MIASGRPSPFQSATSARTSSATKSSPPRVLKTTASASTGSPLPVAVLRY